jgi:hypothetical protein
LTLLWPCGALFAQAWISSPQPGSTLPSTTVTFTWNPIAGADYYWLDVGRTAGYGDICGVQVSGASYTCPNIPPYSPSATTVYVQLWTHINGAWQQPNRYTYGAFHAGEIQSPAPGSQLQSTTVTFTWNAVAGADYYWVDVGKSVAQGDICAGQVSGTSFACAGIPPSPTQTTIYVQLYTHMNGGWLAPNRYTYIPFAAATIQYPAPGSQLPSTNVTFTWNVIAGADSYWIDVGTAQGQGNICASPMTLTYFNCAGIPLASQSVTTIYVQLFTHINGIWQAPNRYTYVPPSNTSDFTLNTMGALTSFCMPAGGGGSFLSYATPVGGFSSTVGLTASATGGVSSTLTDYSTSGTNWLGAKVISLDALNSSAGSYMATITGASGTIQHLKPIPLTVQSAPAPVTQIAAPSRLHTNLGWVPLDEYDANHAPGSTLAAACPGVATVRGCYQAIFQDFRAQGVTGVRFIFPLCAGSIAPLQNCGTSQVTSPSPDPNQDVNNPWIQKLAAFYQDLAGKGIYDVTPTMVHSGDTTGSQLLPLGRAPNGNGCETNPPTHLWYVPLEPYGRVPCHDYEMTCPSNVNCGTYCQADYGHPYDPDHKSGYNCSPSNPIFVGWGNLDNVAAAVIRTAKGAGLNIYEFDVEQELNVTEFPVQARFIYDNAHGPERCIGLACYHDDLTAVEQRMSDSEYPAGRVTWSASDSWRSAGGAECVSVYSTPNRSALGRLIQLDGVANVINGGWFGEPWDWHDQGGVICNGTYCQDGGNNPDTCLHPMAHTPLSHTLPSIVDLHTYPCITHEDGCFNDANANVYTEAGNVFAGVFDFLVRTNNQAATFTVGETHTTANNGCDSNNCEPNPKTCSTTCNIHGPLDAAWQTVDAYNHSSLAGQNVVFRPFINVAAGAGCYFSPANRRLNPNNQGPFKPSVR